MTRKGMRKGMKKEIYVTNDYSIFRRLKGNRAVDAQRVKNVIKSIKQIGYITNPLTVNEKMEVIDGQARLEALESLGLPVEFVIHEGAGVSDCISMNLHQTNWKVEDYIYSYAEQGNQDYIKLYHLCQSFKGLLATDIVCVLYGGAGVPAIGTIREGGFKMPKTLSPLYRHDIERVSAFKETLKKKKTSGSRSYITIFSWMLKTEVIDSEKAFEKIMKYHDLIESTTDHNKILSIMEKIYNYRCADKIYFSSDYLADKDLARRKART